jgi:hypothetical protein
MGTPASSTLTNRISSKVHQQPRFSPALAHLFHHDLVKYLDNQQILRQHLASYLVKEALPI